MVGLEIVGKSPGQFGKTFQFCGKEKGWTFAQPFPL